jgi:hypothetical protein
VFVKIRTKCEKLAEDNQLCTDERAQSRRQEKCIACLALLISLLLATAGVSSGGIEMAWGGAWLMPPGDGQAIVYSAFSDSTRAFDSQGRLIPVPQYKKFELGTYIEYGLTNWLTLVVSPAYL